MNNFIEATSMMTRPVVALFLYVSTAIAATTVTTNNEQTCTSQSLGGDRLNIVCMFAAVVESKPFNFRANFSGGHDDTRAAMKVTLDDAPIACEQGSKISLEGEDGDISLECKFSVGDKTAPGVKHVLKVTLSWSHAQYTNFVFGFIDRERRGLGLVPAVIVITT